MSLIRLLFLLSFLFLIPIENEAQIVVDGNFSESSYQLLSTRLNFNGGFAPDCELTNVYYYVGNNNFYLGAECKIQSQPNLYNPLPDGLGILLDVTSKTGLPPGSILGINEVFDFHYLNGGIEVGWPAYTLEFKADFEVDYLFAVYTDATPNNIFFDVASQTGSTQGTIQNIGTTNQYGSAVTGPYVNGIFSQNSIEFAFQQSPFDGSLKGFEIRIPLSELSATSSDEFVVFVSIVSSTAYFSDQTIPGNVFSGNPGWAPDFLSNLNNINCNCPNPGGTIGDPPYHTLPVNLPVDLTSFSANANGQNIILNWSTATELNNLGFEIQRKVGTNDFVTIGFVNGKGTTTEEQNYGFTDKGLDNGKYNYRLKQVDFNGRYQFSEIVEVEFKVFNSYNLEQNYPNPFNPTTHFEFRIADFGFVSLKIFDVLGNEVATLVDEEKAAGSYEVEFSATGGYSSGGNAYNLPSGIYFYILQSGNYIETKKMMLLK
jgi:hypothetical protein